MYTFDEILQLFNLTPNIKLEDLQRAKKKVLMMHPDKSHLSADYFLFYKKAFDIIMQFYNNQTRQNQKVPTEDTPYEPMDTNEWNKSTSNKINKVIGDMSKETFQEKFNQLFEKNMRKETKADVNDWFSKNDPLYQIDDNAGKNMNASIEHMKKQAASGHMSIYRGVQTLSSSTRSGAGNLYDEDDDDPANQDYVSSDPFSKLKYDDLRKVHKDQTVFAVSERDYDSMTKYASTEQLNRARGQQILTPLAKDEAQRILEQKESQMRNHIMKKEYQAKLDTIKYAEKNKSVLSTFLQLSN